MKVKKCIECHKTPKHVDGKKAQKLSKKEQHQYHANALQKTARNVTKKSIKRPGRKPRPQPVKSVIARKDKEAGKPGGWEARKLKAESRKAEKLKAERKRFTAEIAESAEKRLKLKKNRATPEALFKYQFKYSLFKIKQIKKLICVI